ncbi:LacI family transcriptional regulator [Curtobacterium luteum]|uniref:LacI family transcriptional regulator n=2 Tax=Curtobacterium TaxID=2034 RepID=A0ABS2RXT2_9MICO|nr:LacI family DNA-binding transcriptional regulator [Curtobacterium luteum]MBM7803807.1 LacI family transcriptional regulator [Curtobacterium luteum]NUU51470.1 LacI family transcriptional regulator [Curtobacterium luteum]
MAGQRTAPPTVYDVASAAGVSIATVSRVLRTPDAVREGTRDRVQAAIRTLGYVPSGNARALAGKRTGVVGLLLPGFDVVPDERPDLVTDGGVRVVDDRRHVTQPFSSNLYFDEVLRGAELEAWQRGLALMVAAGRGPSRDVIVNDVAGRVDGLAVLAQTVPDELLEHVARRIPVVVLADDRRSHGFDSVSVDNAAGMRTVVSHVVGRLGIRSIAYVAGPIDSPDDMERAAGFRDALVEHGVDPADVSVVHGDFGRARARELATALFAGEVPRAVVCSNDQSALGVLDAAAATGIRVPEDVVVTGFDGIDAGRFSSPRLTTVHQPMGELGRAAVRAIVERLAHPDGPPRAVRLPVEVLLRESCPPTLDA